MTPLRWGRDLRFTVFFCIFRGIEGQEKGSILSYTLPPLMYRINAILSNKATGLFVCTVKSFVFLFLFHYIWRQRYIRPRCYWLVFLVHDYFLSTNFDRNSIPIVRKICRRVIEQAVLILKVKKIQNPRL